MRPRWLSPLIVIVALPLIGVVGIASGVEAAPHAAPATHTRGDVATAATADLASTVHQGGGKARARGLRKVHLTRAAARPILPGRR